MELTFNTLVIIVIVVIMLLLSMYFYLKIKQSGVRTLEDILNIPEFLKKIFGGIQ
ncbi:MAG: hypothetical protein QXS37_03060 [Candidatus Aenigmatarchaeota archaeon]